MPLFEYICQKCKRKIERVVFTGEKPEPCDCGSRQLVKLFSVFRVRGGGIRDYNYDDVVDGNRGMTNKDFFGPGGGFKEIHDLPIGEVPKNDYRLAPLPQEKITI